MRAAGPRNSFSCRPFLFCEKETVRTPKKKAVRDRAECSCLRRRATLLSPGSTPSGRYALPLRDFRNRTAPLGGACVWHLGRAPQRGPDAPRKQHHARRRRAVALPAFSHRSLAPGGENICPRLSQGPFSLAARNRFFLGPSKKKWVRELPDQERVFCRPFLFCEKWPLVVDLSFYGVRFCRRLALFG